MNKENNSNPLPEQSAPS